MQNKNWLVKQVLEGNTVSLLPLKKEHAQALIQAASDGQLWNLWYTSVPDASSIHLHIETALSEQETGNGLPFVVVDNSTQKIVGSTRFCHADSLNKRVEIGFTWYAKSYQRTQTNTECKYLLLSYAFEELSAIAVEFRTHWHNHSSRDAITRLGAKQDGVLRHHQKLSNGSYRDTVVYSIIDVEWPAVKSSLIFKLQKHD
jgi:RimJ/RimL family protein N-acetyltransferase